MQLEHRELLNACSCGHKKDSKYILETPIYSLTGWVLLCLGVTAKPRKIIFKCQRCGDILEESHSPDAIRRHI